MSALRANRNRSGFARIMFAHAIHTQAACRGVVTVRFARLRVAAQLVRCTRGTKKVIIRSTATAPIRLETMNVGEFGFFRLVLFFFFSICRCCNSLRALLLLLLVLFSLCCGCHPCREKCYDTSIGYPNVVCANYDASIIIILNIILHSDKTCQ